MRPLLLRRCQKVWDEFPVKGGRGTRGAGEDAPAASLGPGTGQTHFKAQVVSVNGDVLTGHVRLLGS